MTSTNLLRSRVRCQVSSTVLQTSGVGDCSAEFNPKATGTLACPSANYVTIETLLCSGFIMAWIAGQMLREGYYTVERELGRGRFGITYLVRKQDGARRVIKALNDDLLQSLNQSDRKRLEELFHGEAVTLAKCVHPNIVKVKEPFKEGQQWCFAMDYVDGTSLSDRILPLPEMEALNYMQQIGEALEVVHQNRLIHRDVKPENIIVRIREGKPEAILIDFGLAFDYDDSFKTIQTRERAEGFAPLEMYSQQVHQVGAYTDVYSLAATLYVLLTGTVPPSAIKRKVDKARLVPPKELNSQVSDRTNRAILSGMKLGINDRPQTVREWLDLMKLDELSSLPDQAPQSRQLSLEEQLKIAALVVAAIAALGGIGSFLSGLSSWLKPPSTPAPAASPSKTP